jgi:hypothetical protein
MRGITPRNLAAQINQRLKNNPVVAILGPANVENHFGPLNYQTAEKDPIKRQIVIDAIKIILKIRVYIRNPT